VGTKLLRLLGYLWATPWTLIFLLMLLVAWALRRVKPVRWAHGAWDWQVTRGRGLEWLLDGWVAVTLGWICLWTNRPHWLGIDAPYMDERVYVLHERRHLTQNMIFGPLFYPLYILGSLLAWSYHDNPFEIDARNHQV
jgi:hypothetical protein